MGNNSYKLAIVGTKDQILGFTALGMTAIAVNDFETAREKILGLVSSNVEGASGEMRKEYAIIFVMEEYARQLGKDDYKKINKEALPAVIPIPGIKGSTGYGRERVKKMVEQAVGSDIFG
ncbi:V-type ATP synthase subunit F [bacterium]|nr:V-type ATP synthase subunit F [bacterium]